MYLRKLIISLCILVGIILLLSGIAFWAHQNSEYHTQRNRIANQMLTEFISLRADKQRLKVWLAEYLLTEDANTDVRNHLFTRMRQQLDTLDQLSIRNQLLNPREEDLQHIMEQVKVISLLQSNLYTLEQALKTREIGAHSDDRQVWRTLIALFDKFQDADLPALLQGAITAQKLSASETEHDALHAMQRVKAIMLMISMIGLLFAIGIGVHLSRGLSRPLQQLLDGTKQLQKGNFHHRIDEQGPAEFAELARQFNLMSGYIAEFAAQERLSQQTTEQQVQDRTAELQQALVQLHETESRHKRLLADISHELRTPATSIQGEAEVSLRGKDKDISEYKDSFARVLDASKQLSGRIDDLLMLARGEDRLLQVAVKPTGLAPFVQHTINTVKQQLGSETPLTLDLPDDAHSDDVWLLVDTEKFDSVLRIISDNARQYSPPGQALTLGYIVTSSELQLEFQDQGIGLDARERDQLFQRHFRGAAARKARPDGLGIGLCIAKAIVEAHDGTITLLDNQPQGARVQISLPIFTGPYNENTDY